MDKKNNKLGLLQLLISYFKGELIVLSLHNEELLVDSGKHNKQQLRTAANMLFKTLYSLSH